MGERERGGGVGGGDESQMHTYSTGTLLQQSQERVTIGLAVGGNPTLTLLGLENDFRDQDQQIPSFGLVTSHISVSHLPRRWRKEIMGENGLLCDSELIESLGIA